MYFDRNATQNGAKRSGSAGMHRRSNAAWVSPQAVKVSGRFEFGTGNAPRAWRDAASPGGRCQLFWRLVRRQPGSTSGGGSCVQHRHGGLRGNPYRPVVPGADSGSHVSPAGELRRSAGAPRRLHRRALRVGSDSGPGPGGPTPSTALQPPRRSPLPRRLVEGRGGSRHRGRGHPGPDHASSRGRDDARRALPGRPGAFRSLRARFRRRNASPGVRGGRAANPRALRPPGRAGSAAGGRGRQGQHRPLAGLPGRAGPPGIGSRYRLRRPPAPPPGSCSGTAPATPATFKTSRASSDR